jgi:hypothetical protein
MYFNQRYSWRRVFTLSATFLFTLLIAISCKKKDSNLGKNVLNPDDLLNAAQVDTFTLQTFTIAEDSVITDNPAFCVLGSYNDPKFGTVNANFYTQLRLSGLNPNFGDLNTLTIDSLVLGLEYIGYQGELSRQSLGVYQLTEDLNIDSTYYSFTMKDVQSLNLIEPGYETFRPSPDGITVIGSDTVDTQLRIRLRNSLAQQLVNEAMSGGSNFTTNELFATYFKGLHVRVNNAFQPSGKGAVLYFNLNDPLSKMTLYYTQNGEQKNFDFLINTQCASFNHVEINNIGKPVQNVINDTISGQKEYYAQAFKNRAIVRMAGVKNLPRKSVIHKARLILPIQYQFGSTYAPSNELTVAAMIDGTLTGVGVFGLYDAFNKQYVVDIKNYLQALVSEQISATELILSPRFFITSAERVIFNGPATINKMKPKLIVTYTEF